MADMTSGVRSTIGEKPETVTGSNSKYTDRQYVKVNFNVKRNSKFVLMMSQGV
jgi:hypothetical protein